MFQFLGGGYSGYMDMGTVETMLLVDDTQAWACQAGGRNFQWLECEVKSKEMRN